MSNEKTGRRGKKRIWGKDDTELSLLALPTTIWYLLFCFLPMFGIIIAFKNYKVYGGFLTSFIKSEWVGFNNFKFLFSSKDIWLMNGKLLQNCGTLQGTRWIQEVRRGNLF